RAQEAVLAAREALAIDSARGRSANLAESLQSLAGALLDVGDSTQAIQLYRQALTALRARLRDDDPEIVSALLDLVGALRGGSASERVEADSLSRYALQIQRHLLAAASVMAGDTSRGRVRQPTPTVSVAPGKIVFTSDRAGPDPHGDLGNQEIYIMNADGTGQTRLTHNGARDVAPALSPDGRTIAFVSDRTGTREIFLINADGTDERQLTKAGVNPEMISAQA